MKTMRPSKVLRICLCCDLSSLNSPDIVESLSNTNTIRTTKMRQQKPRPIYNRTQGLRNSHANLEKSRFYDIATLFIDMHTPHARRHATLPCTILPFVHLLLLDSAICNAATATRNAGPHAATVTSRGCHNHEIQEQEPQLRPCRHHGLQDQEPQPPGFTRHSAQPVPQFTLFYLLASTRLPRVTTCEWPRAYRRRRTQ